MDANLMNYLIFIVMLAVGLTGIGYWATWYDKKHQQEDAGE